MFTVTKFIEFDAGHRVPNHKSKCRSPHGHRYKVAATVEGPLVTTEGASDEGMVRDFGDIKEVMMRRIHDVLDHGFIIFEDDVIMRHLFWRDAIPERMPNPEGFKIILFPYIPTAENIARWCFEEIEAELDQGDIASVTVWETPNSFATVTSEAFVA